MSERWEEVPEFELDEVVVVEDAGVSDHAFVSEDGVFHTFIVLQTSGYANDPEKPDIKTRPLAMDPERAMRVGVTMYKMAVEAIRGHGRDPNHN